LYHFENPAIVAMKSGIVTFIHIKSIKVTSGFNLTIVKKGGAVIQKNQKQMLKS
jgi:hypothetical protein